MNDDELRQIKSSDNPDEEFIRLWTMKEATIKLLGTTISNGMKELLIPDKYKYTTVVRQRYIYTICE
jgi:4'-phosphopantetheinyl transferase